VLSRRERVTTQLKLLWPDPCGNIGLPAETSASSGPSVLQNAGVAAQVRRAQLISPAASLLTHTFLRAGWGGGSFETRHSCGPDSLKRWPRCQTRRHKYRQPKPSAFVPPSRDKPSGQPHLDPCSSHLRADRWNLIAFLQLRSPSCTG